MTRPRRYWADEHGQTLVVSMLMLTVILASAAVAIEGGNLLLQRRNLQGNADAAALAAAAHLPESSGLADATARSYVTTENAADGAAVDDVDITNNSTEVRVAVRKQSDGSFFDFLGMSPPIVRAEATAGVGMMATSASQGMLPLAFMRDAYTLGSSAEIKTDTPGSGNRGAIAPYNNPPHCYTSSGGSDFRELIMGDGNGGMDACAYDIGDTLPSEPGNMSGPTRTGFDTRVGSNTDSFDDLFTYDAAAGRWSVRTMDSPRVGIVPVVENLDGSTSWTGGSTNLRVTGYVVVYIGKMDSPPDYPAYTNNGKSVWVTPVAATLPEDFGEITDWYEGSGDEPVAIHLID